MKSSANGIQPKESHNNHQQIKQTKIIHTAQNNQANKDDQRIIFFFLFSISISIMLYFDGKMWTNEQAHIFYQAELI